MTIANCWLSEVRVGFGVITKFWVPVGVPVALLTTPICVVPAVVNRLGGMVAMTVVPLL